VRREALLLNTDSPWSGKSTHVEARSGVRLQRESVFFLGRNMQTSIVYVIPVMLR